MKVSTTAVVTWEQRRVSFYYTAKCIFQAQPYLWIALHDIISKNRKALLRAKNKPRCVQPTTELTEIKGSVISIFKKQVVETCKSVRQKCGAVMGGKIGALIITVTSEKAKRMWGSRTRRERHGIPCKAACCFLRSVDHISLLALLRRTATGLDKTVHKDTFKCTATYQLYRNLGYD